MKQTISVVIPCYNEEKALGKCLTAIANQTRKPDEVIVVDNNSQDKTVEIAKQFSFVKIVKERRQGLFYSRQTGMARAKGDVICRVDADTVLDSHWIERVEELFADPSTQAASGPMGYHDFLLPEVARQIEHGFLLGARALRYHFLFGCNMAIRQSAWRQVQAELCSDPKVLEDIDIAMHLKAHGLKIVYDRGLSAMVSIRRAEDNPLQFTSYISGHSYTLRKHGVPTVAGRYAEASFLLGYLAFKPLLMVYDTDRRRLSRSKLLYGAAKRPNPMSASSK